MLWYDRNYEEELGWAAESWLLSQQNARPRLEEDSAVVKIVREVLAKLLEGSELAKDLRSIQLYVVDDYRKLVPNVEVDILLIRVVEPYACSTPGLDGGRIFINTGELFVCESVDEVAGVMAHELGHIIARHIPERRASEAFARSIAQVFGWNAALGHDLISWRVRIYPQKPNHFFFSSLFHILKAN
jgi:predicted Zn-dependent protease